MKYWSASYVTENSVPKASQAKRLAIQKNERYYLGSVCVAHSSLEGKRYVSDSRCPLCAGAKVAAYRKTPRGRANVIANARLRKYGVTPEQFQQLLDGQQGRCAICSAAQPGGRDNAWHLDHNHTTRKVRGVLCHKCNVALGLFGDSAALLRAAVIYLEVA